ncbi:MAG: hypothetical protein PHO86_00045 [Bacilli bacterium]|nr:hypothetical protein [Bacilli bacterium]
MEIRKNEKLREYVVEMSQLKELYSSEYNTVTSYFWPIVAKNKKALKDRIYYTGAMTCLLIFIIVVILLGGLKNEYLIWGSIIISLLLIGIGVFLSIKSAKEKKQIYEEWEKNNKKIYDIQDRIHQVTIDAAIEIPYVICYSKNYDDIIKGKLVVGSEEWNNLLEATKQEMLDDTAGSTAYEDVIGYYNTWSDNF